MRTIAFVLSAAIVAAACSDTRPTSPTNARSFEPNVQALGDKAPTPQGKTTGPVAFTKITQVTGQTVSVPANSYGYASATCPAGSFVVGGGYTMGAYLGDHPIVYRSYAIDATTWVVYIDVTGQPSSASIAVLAQCAS